MTKRTITSVFGAAAASRPEAIAIALGARSITYGELARESDITAGALWSLGVRPGTPVIVAAERTVETVVAVLAILKCGAFYVPVDPRWPASRMAHIVSVTGAALALSVNEELECGPDTRRVAVKDLARTGTPFREVEACEQTIAYVMFTSGSTGVPKAIAVPHRGVVRLALNPNYMTVVPDDVFLYNSTLAFDASTFEIWSALLNGCRLEICPPGVSAAEVIRDRGVTIAFLTSGLFTVLIEEEADRLTRLRTLVVGGDVLSVRAAKRALRKLPSTRFVNAYGPTENSAFSTCHIVAMDDTNGPVPIGRAIQETTVSVLDANLHPVAAGAEGELVTGGAGVAIGYYGNPALTAERFIPDPDANPPGARLYRTGDIVRQRRNGAIEFVGRNDDQVKVSGFRIELGEIEHAAVAFAGAREACAGVRNGRIHLWYIAAKDLDTVALRNLLRDRLPHYAVPAFIVRVDTFPLSASGKIDRAALPDPPLPADAENEQRLGAEHTIAQIWSEVLNIPLPSNTLDFFAAGGDSLSAMRVMNRMRAAFGCEIPASEFLPDATVAKLARIVPERVPANAPPTPFSFESGPGKRMPLTFSQERVFFLQQLEPESLAYNFQALIGFRGLLDVGALRTALNRIVERHEIYRSTFEFDDVQPVQVVQEADAFIDLVDLRGMADPEAELRSLVDAEVRWRAEVHKLPLIRWVLYQVAADEFRLLHLENHLVHDGWSFNIFLAELIDFYREAAEGIPARVQQPLQSGQFAAWQRSLLASGTIDRQLDYWTKKLAGTGAPLPLPFDHPSVVRHPRGGHLRFELNERECAEIVAAAMRNHCSPFMVMAAAFAELLHRECGTPDVTFGTGFADRQNTAAESVITMAVNSVALRCNLSGRPTVGELLARVRRTVFEAQENQDAPFDRVVTRVSPERRAGVNPIFNTMFSFHDSPDVDVRLRDVEVTLRESLPNGSTKFDMNVVVVRQIYDGRGRSGGRGESWKVIWDYNADRFEERTVDRLVSRYRRLLEAITVSDSSLVADLDPELPAGHALDGRERISRRPDREARQATSVSPMEELVASIWQEVIGVAGIDRDVDFFDLGGHSLLALRITARLDRRLGIGVPLSILFETRTVRGMAAALDGLISPSAVSSLAQERFEEREI